MAKSDEREDDGESTELAEGEENRMTEAQKKELRSRVLELKDKIEGGYFEFAELVYSVYDSSAFTEWTGEVWNDEEQATVRKQFESFQEWCENELGISARKGNYYVSMVRWFKHEIEDPSVIEKVKGLGWSKVKELTGVVTSANVDEWVKKASEMTVAQLTAECAKALRGDDDSTPSDVVRKSFQLAAEQAKVVEAALEHAGETAESDKQGHLLTLVCQDYLAGAVRPTKSSQKNAYLAKMETILGVKLFAVDVETGKPLFGKSLLKKVNEKGELAGVESDQSDPPAAPPAANGA